MVNEDRYREYMKQREEDDIRKASLAKKIRWTVFVVISLTATSWLRWAIFNNRLTIGDPVVAEHVDMVEPVMTEPEPPRLTPLEFATNRSSNVLNDSEFATLHIRDVGGQFYLVY